MSTMLRVFLLLCALLVAVTGHVLYAETHQRAVRNVEEQPKNGEPEMTKFHVESHIYYRYAKTTVATRLTNRGNASQELSFHAVLPDSAFISAFHIELDGEVYHAYVKTKEEANREYNAAVSQGRTAAKVDHSARDSNRFTVSVNVEATAKVTFNLTYEELLTRRLGVYNHVINIDPGQIVPDLSVLVHIEESNPLVKLSVPSLRTSNEIETTEVSTNDRLVSLVTPAANKATVTWTPTADQQRELRADGVRGQLTVQYDVERDENPSQILVSDGYFVHFYSPADLVPLNKHVVFVLDNSGSMYNQKLGQLKEAMVTILGDLRTGDYFSLVIFSTGVEAWDPETKQLMEVSIRKETVLPAQLIIPVTPDSISNAKTFVQALDTAGSTNINDALHIGLEVLKLGRKTLKPPSVAQNPEAMMIFLTDGQANVGVTNTDEIVNQVTAKNKRGASIFSLAFGSDADKDFLKKLSLKNAAFSRLIYEASDAALQLRDFYRQISSPLLANVTFNYEPDQVVNTSLTNVHFNTLFSGSELVVSGKLASQSDRVRGILLAKSSNGKSRYGFPSPMVIDVDWHETAVENKTQTPFMEKLWAYLTIQQLLDKDKQDGGEASKKAALAMALKYSFVTPLTSLVVVKPNETRETDVVDASKPVLDDSSSSSQALNYHQKSLPVSFRLSAAPAPAVDAMDVRHYAVYEDHLHADFDSDYSDPTGNVMHYYVPPTYTLMPTARTTPRTTTTVKPFLTLNDIVWPADSNNGTHLLIPQVLEVANNQSNEAFAACTAPGGGSSHCRHLAYCVLRIFSHNFDLYKSDYLCHIDGFAGACCPDGSSSPSDVSSHSL